jgi:transposase
MSEVYRRCCGMDVHKETVVVCVLAQDGEDASPIKKVFSTFRNELTRMRGWLKRLKVTEIAMESTGVYWRPIWNALEDQGFQLLLVNPAQVKALRGRKSDRRDCQRIAEFLQDRRLDPSFVPPVQIRELRCLLRGRVAVLQHRNEVINRIDDVLQTASIKLSSTVSDLMGTSSQAILKAIIDGQDSPERLSWKARGRLRKKTAEVKESVKGYLTEFHRWMLKFHYEQYEELSRRIEQLETKIREHMQPYKEQIELLDTIPGVDEIVAWHLISELGVDMSVFPTADHCASWAGLCPGDNQSAGKQISNKTKKGNKYLRRTLAQSAWAASRKKNTYLRAMFHRIRSRRGWPKAIIAVAHKILISTYWILATGQPYLELGNDYFDKLRPARTANRLIQRLTNLGLTVTVQPTEEPNA